MPIFDQGYQHWKGPLTGHAWRWLVIARNGVKAQLSGKLVRILLFVAWMPALVLVLALVAWGLLEQRAESVLSVLRPILPPNLIQNPQEYRSAVWTIAYSFFFKAELSFSLLLVMIVGPNLISRDLRMNALPLYFSRPLRRSDYFLGKLGIIGFYLAAIAVVPAAVAYLVGVAFSLDMSVIRDTHRLLWGGAAYGLVITVSAGSLMLALSSLTRRSIYVGLAWAGFCFLTMMTSGILTEVRYETDRATTVQEGMDKWLADHPAPAGVELMGSWPRLKSASDLSAAEREKQQKWMQDWRAARRRQQEKAEITKTADIRRDWRPVVSYPSNLDRIGDALLGTDAAWVTIGKAIERPRTTLGPIVAMNIGPHQIPPELTEPGNDRRLAELMVWQFPWGWSAAVLGGLLLLSLLVLTSRVKSLDRLK
ncbi:MAG: hypothetical protein K1X57_21060 [Gemmataceae bacterium]|nr:hypothetical protein [Gemmataceae bacterium]